MTSKVSREAKRLAVWSAAVAAACGLTPGAARAVTTTWDGGNATAPHWSQADNWDAGEPTALDDAVFPAAIPAVPGATISLGVGELANSLSLNGNYILGTAAGTGDLTLSTGNVSVNPGVTAVIASQLKGTGGLDLSGGGTLNLTNTTTVAATANSFNGGITVTGGSTLQFSVDNALGATASNNITLDGGTIASTHTTGTVTFNAGRIFTIGAGGGTIATAPGTSSTNGKLAVTGPQLTGSGPFTKTGGGALQITTGSTFTGSFTISGLLEASASTALGSGPVTLTKAGELAIGSGSNVANAITISAAGTGADPIFSPINSTTQISGAVNTAGNPFTVALRDFNNAANGRNFIISGALTGAGALTTAAPTAGNGYVLLNGNNTGYSGAINAVAGTGVSFGTANSRGTGALSVASSGAALGGVGVGFVPASQADLPSINTNTTGSNGGVFTINTTGFNAALDLDTLYGTGSGPTGGTAGRWFLGSATTGTYAANTLGASSDGVYRLGGGGGTLTIAPTTANAAVLTGANNLAIGSATINGGGTVTINTTGNSFTGSVSVNNGTLSIASVANGGANSPIGAGTGPVTIGFGTFAAGLTYSGATAATDRGITLAGTGTKTVTISTAATTLTVGPLAGTTTTPLTKAGGGTLTATGTAAASFGTLSVNAGTLNLNPAANTVAGDLLVGVGTTALTGTLNVPAGGSLSAGSGSTNTVRVGVATLTSGTGVTDTGTVDASAATTFSANVGNFEVGFDAGNLSGQVGNGTVRLATGTNTITAATAVRIGVGGGNSSPAVGLLTLGPAANTITTPTMTVGGPKSGGTVNFRAGTTAGALTLNNGANRTTLNVGTNTVDTAGTQPVSNVDLTGGRFTASLAAVTVAQKTVGGAAGRSTATLNLGADPATNVSISVATGNALRAGVFDFSTGAQPTTGLADGTIVIGGGTVNITTATASSAVLLGQFNTTTAISGATATNAATGTLRITGGNVTIDNPAGGNSVGMAVRTVAAGTVGANTSSGTLEITGGSLTVNAPIFGNTAAGAQTSNLILTGGLLNMQNRSITVTNFTFGGGGILRNPSTVNQSLTQNGAASILDVDANSATIAGNYALTSGTAVVAAGRTLSITGAAAGNATIGAGGVFAPELDVSGTPAAGQLAAVNALDLTAAGDTLNLLPQQPITTQTTFTIATFASETGVFDTVLTNGLPTQSANPAQPNYVLVTYNPTNIQVTANNLAAVPEPASIGLLGLGAVGLLARRRRRLA